MAQRAQSHSGWLTARTAQRANAGVPFAACGLTGRVAAASNWREMSRQTAAALGGELLRTGPAAAGIGTLIVMHAVH